MKHKRVLFLLKESYHYGDYATCKAGLYTSAVLVARALRHHLGVEAEVKICLDGNSIDKDVTSFKPDYCILEAIWVTPEKLAELVKLHPHVIFVVRIHSKTPFLAMEGVAISWIKQFDKLHNVIVGFNNLETAKDFNDLLHGVFYLPNLYYHVDVPRVSLADRIFVDRPHKRSIDIGCFGAIRPMKNQLEQAVASIIYGNKNNKTVHFHINSSRVEQSGENVLKNLRSLFEGTDHELVEHDWLDRHDFLNLVKKMDLGLQLSLTESFNIVTADFVSQLIPIIVSDEISWMPKINKVGSSDTDGIIEKIQDMQDRRKFVVARQAEALNEYDEHSLKYWSYFLH
jgi:hypothetical protein